MEFTRTSPINRTSPLTEDELIAAWVPDTPPDQMANMKRAARATVLVSRATGIDPFLLSGIGWVETGYGDRGLPFRHPNWIDDFNFGNLGKTGDPAQDAAAQTWSTPEDGVMASAAHLVAYRWGDEWRRAWDVDELGDPKVRDKRFDLAIANTPSRKGLITFGDLNRRWAIDRDDDYGGKLAQRATILANRVEAYRRKNPPVTPPATGEEPTMPTRDPWDIIRPFLVDAFVEKTGPGYGYSAGNRIIVALAEHETQGIMTGPQRSAFFSCPSGERCRDALVDWGIPRNERKIYMYQNPYTTNRIPYASGGVATAITQLARKASAKMGNPYGGVNMFYAAVEIEKNRGQAMTDDQIEMTARLLAFTWAMRNYAPNDAMYPDEFDNEIKTSVNHVDLYTSTNCKINDPDRNKFESMAVGILTDFYAGTATPPVPPTKPTYAPAVPVAALTPYMTADPGGVPAVILAEGSEWIFVNDRVTVARDTPRLQRARADALHVGGMLKKGEVFTAKFMVKAVDGNWYYLTAMFTRVQLRHTARLSDTV